MILIDANLLIYAYNPEATQHERSRAWLEESLDGPDPVGLSWTSILAFLRITTDRRLFEEAAAMSTSAGVVASWLARRNVIVLNPGERHWDILASILDSAHVAGPLVMDADIAALAIEYGATLCTSDRDFARFPGLRVLNPLE